MKGLLDSKITVFEPTEQMIKWCNDNLKVLNPEYVSRMRMNKWVGNTPQHLFLYEVKNGNLVMPYGALQDFSTTFSGIEWETDYMWWDMPSRRMAKMKRDFQLRGYQQDAVDKMAKKFCGILVAPAGCGKTQIGLALASQLGYKTLWVTHTLDLVNQTMIRAKGYFGDKHCGVIAKGKVQIGDYFTCATVQTLKSLNLSEYKNEWDCIIVDECHRVSGSPTANTMFRAVLSQLSAQYKYGLTATLHRADGMVKATESILGHVIHEIPADVVSNYICKVGIVALPLATDESFDYCNTDGTLNYAQMINYLAEDNNRNDMIMKYLVANSHRPTLVLSSRLSQLEYLMYHLPKELRVKACLIRGNSNTETRDKYLIEMRQGKKQILFATYQLAKEGLDIPRLSAVYFCTPEKDKAIVTQAVGRVARIDENKNDPIVLDFIDYNIAYCKKAYKSRQKIYNSLGCYYVNTNRR